MSIFSFLKPKVKIKQEFDLNKIKYPCLVKSSAGTGKTETIANIVVNILKNEDIDISQFAIITFTNKAANEMQERIQSKLETLKDERIRKNLYLCNSANISTIHSFCEKIIREYGLNIGIGTSFVIKSNRPSVATIVGQIIKENFDSEIHSKVSNFKLKELIIKALEENENKGVEHIKYNEDENEEFYNSFNKYFVDIYNKCYDAIVLDRLKNNYLTTNDLIKYAAHLVQDSKVAEQISKKIKYLFIDEFQDTNRQQYELVRCLKNYVKVVVVGDKKQSIYKFRGADLDSYLEMEEDIKSYGEDHIFTSNINYRSDYNYVEEINKLFNKNFKFGNISLNFEKFLSTAYHKESLENKRPIRVDENKNICEIIKKMAVNLANGKNACYNEIVVLCRNNKEVAEIEYLLDKNDIPNITISGRTLFQEEVVVDTIKILEYLIYGDELFKDELGHTIHYLEFSKTNNSKEQFIKVIDTLRDELKEVSISELIEKVFEVSNFSKKSSNYAKHRENISKLKLFAREYSSYVEFYNASLQKIENNEIAFESEENAVVISTIHKFKGLTASNVILFNADVNLLNFKNPQFIISGNKICFSRDILDNYSNIKTSKAYLNEYERYIKDYLEEELRVLYVALTRAKHNTVLCCKYDADKLSWMKRSLEYVSYKTLLNF